MYVPEPGSYLTVDLRGERVRAFVSKVLDRDNVMLELDTQPMMKSHNYRKGDVFGAHRTTTPLEEIWEAEDDRTFFGRFRQAASAATPEPKPKPKPKKKKQPARAGAVPPSHPKTAAKRPAAAKKQAPAPRKRAIMHLTTPRRAAPSTKSSTRKHR